MSYEYINSSGVIVPDTADLLSDVQQEFKDAFGQDLIVTPDTPQGVLITALTIVRDAVVRNNAALANQINPIIAGGIFLDAILALTAYSRFAQTYSYAIVDMAGIAGAVIPAGVTGKNTNGDIFASNLPVTLNSLGQGSVTFTSIVAGPIVATAGTITTIVSGAIGLETITNPADAILGTATESDVDAKVRRKVTLALQGTSLPEAIISGLNKTTGVNSLSFRENVSNVTQIIDGVTMVAHSIYVCVDGGANTDVANTLNNKKGGGCSYNNGPGINVSVPVTNAFSLQVIDVLFDRPNLIPILVKVTVGINQAIEDPTTAVINALIAYANNMIVGETGLVVGQSVSCFELAGAINRQAPELYVQNLQTSLIFPVDFTNNPIPIEVFQKATISPSDITVIIV